MKQAYFLPYQQAWLDDNSRLKIGEKSRRVGWTYAQAYEDVRDAAKKDGAMDVWFTSADISAAREYIRYCEMWARVLDTGARSLGEIVIDSEDDIKALVIELSSGKRINALSSNPKGFRSKGGKVVIDEYAFHENADELWKAASPSILWGYPMRVFSSHNGKNTRFYRMVLEAIQPNSRWSHHKVTIQDAIDDGLVQRIKQLDRPATPEEVDEFMLECKAIAGDDETFEQEFMCNPQDDKSAFISHALIFANEDATVPEPVVILGEDVNEIHHDDYSPEMPIELTPKGKYFLGMDVGRKKDLTVIWILEDVAGVFYTRFVLELHRMKFRHQYKNLSLYLPFMARACLDSTGIGAQLSEDAVDDYGSWRVEAIQFTNAIKGEMAYGLKRAFEDRALRNPATETVQKDIQKIKKSTTAAGHTRFEGERDADGHSDRFWALALAKHAGATGVRGPIEYKTVTPGRNSNDENSAGIYG
jgi:phage FluMu gp28-like protein